MSMESDRSQEKSLPTRRQFPPHSRDDSHRAREPILIVRALCPYRFMALDNLRGHLASARRRMISLFSSTMPA